MIMMTDTWRWLRHNILRDYLLVTIIVFLMGMFWKWPWQWDHNPGSVIYVATYPITVNILALGMGHFLVRAPGWLGCRTWVGVLNRYLAQWFGRKLVYGWRRGLNHRDCWHIVPSLPETDWSCE